MFGGEAREDLKGELSSLSGSPVNLINFSVPTQVNLGQTFQIGCDFGNNTLPCIYAVHNKTGCSWHGWKEGTTVALFNCNANSVGNLNNSCNLFYYGPDERCHEAKGIPISNINVIPSCIAKTCSQLGKQCGSWDNGCGVQLSCGSCLTGQVCNSSGQCVTSSSGYSLKNSYAPAQVNLGDKFQIWCNYSYAPCIGANHSHNSCQWSGWGEGTKAYFNCTANELGIKENFCYIWAYAPDPKCIANVTKISGTNVVAAPYNLELSLATLKNSYAVGEQINLTDPPDDIDEIISEEGINIDERVINGISFNNGVLVNPNQYDGLIYRNYLRDEQGNIIFPDFGRDFQDDFQEGFQESQDELTEPEFDGYIVEFDKDPIIVKKTDTEKEAKKNYEDYQRAGFIRRTYIARTKILPNNVDDVVEVYAKNLEKENEKIKEKVLAEIETEGQLYSKNPFNDFYKNIIRTITGNAVSDVSEETKEKVTDEFNLVFNGIVVKDITEQEAKELENIRGVKRVGPNMRVYANLMDSVPLINADDVWQMDKDGNNCVESGGECLTGKGVTIGIIDTGVDYTHPDLGCKNDDRCGNSIFEYHSILPAIYNNKIVWEDWRNGNADIYMCDLRGNTGDLNFWCNTYMPLGGLKKLTPRCSNRYGPIYGPSIDEGRIAWAGYCESEGDSGIYIYDISTNNLRELSISDPYPMYPKIDNNNVLWRTWDGFKFNTDRIYIYNLDTNNNELVNINGGFVNMYDQDTSLAISGDYVAWVDASSRGINHDIYLYDIINKIETPFITMDLYNQGSLSFSDNKLTWLEWIGGYKSQIYFYEISSNEQLPRPQSKLVNNEAVNVTGDLTIKIQKDDFSGIWQELQIPVRNVRVTIPANGLIKLDTGLDNLGNPAFAGFNNLNVNATSAGQFRVHARFEIPETRQVIEGDWEFVVG